MWCAERRTRWPVPHRTMALASHPALRERLSGLGNRAVPHLRAPRPTRRWGRRGDGYLGHPHDAAHARRTHRTAHGSDERAQPTPDPARRAPRPADARAGGHRSGQRCHSPDHHGRQSRAAEHGGVLCCPLRSQSPSSTPPAGGARAGSTTAATGRPTPPCTASSSPAFAATRGPRRTTNAAPRRARPDVRSSGVSSDMSPVSLQHGQTGFPRPRVIGASVRR